MIVLITWYSLDYLL